MLKNILIILLLTYSQILHSSELDDFNNWLNKFKLRAIKTGISKTTVNNSFKNVKYLEKVIQYDRKQPEFFEDTRTYLKKRATRSKIINAKNILNKNLELFDDIEKKFKVEKELLLALWGIETNFGKYVGKMDIISSLATLSFDQRRSEFFSRELIILLKLIDKQLIQIDTLYGSWAGALGNFQFMPSTIEAYAIDYDENNKVELKDSIYDSIASAANYINKIGWNYKSICFHEVKLTQKIPIKYINTSAKKIKNYQKIKSWKNKGVVGLDNLKIGDDSKAALIMPDGNENSPTYLVFDNYQKILKWNRSLRFGITVCTLANMIKNEI